MNFSTFISDLDYRLRHIGYVSLIAHRAPDGDAYGSLAGFAQLLRDNYSHLTVTIVVPPEKNIDTHIQWILDDTKMAFSPQTELVFLLDTSLLSRTALTPTDYPSQPIITIDHHEFLPGSIE